MGWNLRRISKFEVSDRTHRLPKPDLLTFALAGHRVYEFVFARSPAGPIPAELGKLAALEDLHLAGNKLSGEPNPRMKVETLVCRQGKWSRRNNTPEGWARYSPLCTYLIQDLFPRRWGFTKDSCHSFYQQPNQQANQPANRAGRANSGVSMFPNVLDSFLPSAWLKLNNLGHIGRQNITFPNMLPTNSPAGCVVRAEEQYSACVGSKARGAMKAGCTQIRFRWKAFF